MLRIAIVFLYVVVCYKYGNLRNWREYYPSFLYAIIGDLSYNLLFYNHTLWKYDGLVNHTFSDYLEAFVVFPCAIILYLTYYPKCFWKQILYILGWTGINTIVEFISFKTGYFSYYNGWNLIYSAVVFFIAFILVRLHYRYPLPVWAISGVFALITMYLFNQPITNLK